MHTSSQRLINANGFSMGGVSYFVHNTLLVLALFERRLIGQEEDYAQYY
jgi:hypothetical protein